MPRCCPRGAHADPPCEPHWATGFGPLESGVDGPILALDVFDDGSGPALYAGGWFTTAGGVAASGIARWDGSAWSPLGSGVSGFPAGAVYALTAFDDGSGPALYVGGRFFAAGDQESFRIAKWVGCAPVVCAGDADCDGDVDFFDIDPFVAKLGCPGSDPVACGDGCAWENADIDADGDVDFFDIDPFVARFGSVCP